MKQTKMPDCIVTHGAVSGENTYIRLNRVLEIVNKRCYTYSEQAKKSLPEAKALLIRYVVMKLGLEICGDILKITKGAPNDDKDDNGNNPAPDQGLGDNRGVGEVERVEQDG